MYFESFVVIVRCLTYDPLAWSMSQFIENIVSYRQNNSGRHSHHFERSLLHTISNTWFWHDKRQSLRLNLFNAFAPQLNHLIRQNDGNKSPQSVTCDHNLTFRVRASVIFRHFTLALLNPLVKRVSCCSFTLMQSRFKVEIASRQSFV